MGKISRRYISSTSWFNKLYFKVVKTTSQELRQLFRKSYGEQIVKKFNDFPLVKSFSQTIIDDNDFQSHNTEIKIPELPAGYYVILSSLTEDFKYENNRPLSPNQENIMRYWESKYQKESGIAIDPIGLSEHTLNNWGGKDSWEAKVNEVFQEGKQ